MISHNEAYYESRRPIQDLGAVGNFKRIIWNPEKRAFLDRTAKEWATVGLFYLCFFGALFSIFALQLWITLDFVADLKRPYLKHSSQVPEEFFAERRSLFHAPLIKFENPGLGFVPNIIQTATSSPIMWISDTNKNGDPERYATAIRKFLSDYKRDRSNYDVNCSARPSRSVSRTKPCFFDVTKLGNCSIPPFGYKFPYQPCIFIKLNKRYDWTPNYYNSTSDLPEVMPGDLKQAIKLSKEGKIWLSCNGVKNVDKEHMGMISYFPSPGFPFYYFPFTGHSQYLSPVVAIMFHNLTVNRLVNVECHTWAKNIGDSRALDFQIVTFS
ncbi:sodium/potassium-transporting ATPase subunit beta-1-like [Diachasmimorpha longicaudata]|uniref:sodium/potassium-transporting ATPase subunit beta-1-like n=1 Tax=Diachasmimorpha longicaudata TaxID=58733 RepID=UPI0030B8BA50